MGQAANAKMISKLLFRLLPIQILLAAVGSVNGLVSSFFASNYVGVDAMSAVGLYSPLNMLVNAVSTILVGGAVILCGRYMGRNEQEKVQSIFTLELILSAVTAAVFTGAFLLMGLLDLTGLLTRDPAVRPLFDRYLAGQAIGVVPFLLGNSLAAFLSLENKGRRTITASLVYIAVNVALNGLFVRVLRMEALGLALASSLGMWVFTAVQARYFLTGRSYFRLRAGGLSWGDSGDIFRIGVPGALSNVYQTARGLIVNHLLGVYVGSAGLSAFAAADNLLRIFWSLPVGMMAVSRMLFSVSVGEEDRQTLADVRVVHKNGQVILRIKDDCVPFDPGERQKMTAGEDITKNIGLRMVFRIARDIQYQNILGLNVLTIRI